jgi:hypothetical protein
MPPGMNHQCEWPDDLATTLDLRNPVDRQHLIDDARVVEELVVRHTDARWGHGAHIRKQQTRQECFTAMFAAVARTHQVAVDDVREARKRLSDNRLDLAVHLPMAAIYVLVVFSVSGRVFRRFDRGETPARFVAIFLVAVAVSATMVMIGGQWAAAVEMVRVGNDHLSFRGRNIAWNQQVAELFFVGLVAFWTVALLRYHVTHQREAASARPGPTSEECRPFTAVITGNFTQSEANRVADGIRER